MTQLDTLQCVSSSNLSLGARIVERRWQVLIVVCIGVFMSSLDLFIVNIAFPDIQADFAGTSLGDLSWILNAYAIVFAALLVPAGRWADEVGRKRAFLGGLVLFTAASAACAVAGSVEVLVAARVAQAAGGALLIPTSLGLLLPEFSAEQRPVAIGIWAAAGGVAAAAGPPVGGLLVGLSWHWVFLVNIPVGLGALIAGSRVLREIRDPAPHRPDVLGALAVVGGIAALIGGIVNGDGWGWGSPETLGAFALSALLLAVVARRSLTHPAPIVEPEIVGVRSFRLAVTGAGLFFVAFAAMLLGSVLFLTNVWHEDVLTAGLMIAPGPTAAALMSVPGARLGQRIGPHRTGAIGGALFALAAGIWLWRLGDDVSYLGDFLPAFVIGGLGVGLVNPAVTAAAAASLPPTRFATGAALLTMGRQLGTAVGVALLVPILGTPADAASFDGAWVLMLSAAGLAGLTMLAIGPLAVPTKDVAVASPNPSPVPVAQEVLA
jgi:EmrB/QacA subfamily drug resistance transporter